MAEELGDFIEASGLMEYDPEAIAKIYQGNPFRLLKRIWQTLLPIGLFLIGVGIDKLLGRLKNKSKAKARAKECANLLFDLGPAFIKAGQALSTRPDIIPTVLLDELSQLQDQLPGFDSKLAMACIEEDLGKKINNIFASLEKEPISAASLGQVHKGVLKNGEIVAVKVQRPGLREQITLDLYIVRNIAIWLKQNIKLIRSDLVALIDELGKRVFEEMDYLNEAANAEKFKSLHKHNINIAVPKIYKDATSKRVLTMEWIEGVKLTNIDSVKKLGIDPKRMIDIGVNCSLQQLLEHGFFHADPHPGNLLALEDGRLCYLDFGMMSEITRESRTGLIQAVVHLVNQNYKELSKDFVKLGFLSEKINLKPIVPEFEKVFSSVVDIGVNKMDFKSVTDDMSGVMYKFPFKVPPYYALIIRSLITLEGIALSVEPDFKILGASYPYFAKRLVEDPDPQLRESLKEMVFDGEKFSLARVENLIKSTGNTEKLDIISVIDDILNYLYSEKGGLLRNEVVEAIVNRMDNINWDIIKIINGLLPKKLRSTKIGTKENSTLAINNFSKRLFKFKKFLGIMKNIPGLKKEILFKKIPRVITEPNSRHMTIKVAKRVTEKSIVKIIKLAAGENI